jgi:Ca-activated chloride channel family protein
MRFANYIFLIILAIYLFDVFYRRKKGEKKRRASFLFSSVAPFSGVKESKALRVLGNLKFLKVAAFSMVLIALARPQVADVARESETFGIDIVLTLDVSGSMMAEDLQPNRLEAAKVVLNEFITERRTDRLGLVVFAGKSYTQSPLTTDYGILLNLLSEVEINHTDQGTAIGMAISDSLNRLKSSAAKSRVVILLTDGESNKGSIDPLLAAKMANALGIRVYTIGIGTGEGVPVPISGVRGEEYATTRDGKMIITKLNEDGLKNIAGITGGQYYRATSRETLSDIYKKIGELERSKIEMTKFFSYYELFPYFAFLALLLLFVEVTLTTTKYSTFP